MADQGAYALALSFFPLDGEDIRFSVYRRAPVEGETYEGLKQRKLPSAATADNGQEEYRQYWVSYVEREGFDPYECTAHTNNDLTKGYLHRLLRESCERSLAPSDWSLDEERFDPQFIFVHKSFPEGMQAVWLRPFFLRIRQRFGFLADFKFYAGEGVGTSRRTLEHSLALKRGRQNVDFYADRYDMVRAFVDRYHHRLFPLRDGQTEIRVARGLQGLRGQLLKPKTYVFGGERTAQHQFVGVRENGPLEGADADAKLVFVYRPIDKPLSHDLFRALRGDTFPTTFPGMEQVFGVEMDESRVSGVPVANFGVDALRKATERIHAAHKGTVVPVVLVPFAKDGGEDDHRAYYATKHAFLSEKLPSQFVAVKNMKDVNAFKWMVSNIGLAVFAKMGGSPWKLQPETDRCLIVGLSQSHRIVDEQVQKYFAYSVLTDSSGLYKEVRVLGSSEDEKSYVDEFKDRLEAIFVHYRAAYDRFAIHASFRIKERELEAVKDVLARIRTAEDGLAPAEFVVLKFNDKNQYFGYSPKENSMVPYEGTYAPLSHTEYLVWFEGLARRSSNLSKQVHRPVHIQFIYPKDITQEEIVRHLQDAGNLSGANWRGFNARSLPVSVYYAKLISDYYAAFDAQGLEEIDLTAVTPWFL